MASCLIVNSSLEVVASSSPKLEVLGVNLQVIEVKELKFDIYFQGIFMKESNSFSTKLNQQLFDSCPGPFGPFFGAK